MRVWRFSALARRAVGMASARAATLILAWAICGGTLATAEEPAATPAAGDADAKFAAAMNSAAPEAPPAAEAGEKSAPKEEGINLLQMASPSNNGGGGVFMYPIYVFSFIVVLFGIERMFGMRRQKIIPQGLVDGFGALANNQQGFDPRKAYRLCQQFPSTASNVIKSMLVKIGRPHSELEHDVAQANEREAAKLYKNVRPLNLAATAAPLLGLIGTVQGMIMAFYVTAHLPDGANKAQKLAEGVYVALITTFAGLCVAIPAVVLSHYLEGKIQALFREIDELVYNLLPQLERYEGKLRVNSKTLAGETDRPEAKPVPRQPAATSEG
jgi:biopolymer transport protein ExbB